MPDTQVLSSADELQTVSFLRRRSQLLGESREEASAHSVIWQRLACLVRFVHASACLLTAGYLHELI